MNLREQGKTIIEGYYGVETPHNGEFALGIHDDLIGRRWL